MLAIDVDVSAGTELLQQIIDRLDNPRDALTVLGDLLGDYEREVFATDGFGTWATLDPATVRAKDCNRILVDTGEALRHLTGSPDISGESVTASGPSYLDYLRQGARGMPKRDATPTPTPAHLDDWAEGLLGSLVHGRRR
ncbi:hypothetical protein [Nocardioides lianchengensis]|uniref:Uncharacterized protein n=1 Tax=Nocardioides lianchengensis TaxID=1045774 RepID=A0A1G6LS78_9ACTN|nr:hypothetical protein [Nocardioides lianchengensis]NYG12460.1 hypothetical protein [Nocardioides lianchengensis]SDC46103.1 hypothetical protein SAMN05421872_102344 [Nocardioides lianchengensis]